MPGLAPGLAPIVPMPTRPFILLVDDHDPSLQRLCEVVELAGHCCVAAHSGADALVYCDTHRPQVVVTDLSMPGLDGEVLAHWLKARYPSTPVLLMTGEDLNDPSVVPFREIFEAVMPKPIDPEHLLDLLTGLMPPPRN